MGLEHYLKNKYLKAGQYILSYIYNEQKQGRTFALFFYQSLIEKSSEFLNLDSETLDKRLKSRGLIEIVHNHVQLTYRGYYAIEGDRIDPFGALFRIQNGNSEFSPSKIAKKKGKSNRRRILTKKQGKKDYDDLLNEDL
ncbi:hypothetical protein CL617_01730 [archaeon]|nr:hypothetical protein [archaeon]|tara:strand:- start:2479 stop:2895 length:417 start_codon:yes stop_codon:yes gene_type:complete